MTKGGVQSKAGPSRLSANEAGPSTGGRPVSPSSFWGGSGSGGVGSTVLTVKPYDLKPTGSLSMSSKQFRKFVEGVKNNGINEPIKYVEYKGEKYVVNGHHRLRAAKTLGLDSVPVEQVKLPYKGYRDVKDLLDYFGP